MVTKKYNHWLIEKDKNKKWVNKKYFQANGQGKPFTIIIPPPNVTGKLHIGHAWNGTLQDTIIRYKKLKNFDVLWLPATDHAGIATQAKVEERLKKNNISKYDLGRKKFLKKAFEWKNEYAKIIHQQWHKLGLALDYSNERFTLDNDANQAVNKVFINLYKKGLIYRGKRAIYFDVKLNTALSNIEIINKEINQKMYYLKYYLENSKDYIIVATTRTETLASDVAIIFNPKDKKYKKFLGKKVISPFTKKIIPILEHSHADSKFGSGILKISAHAMPDFDIIKEFNLELNESIDKNGRMNKMALEFEGLDRFEAREKISKKLMQEGLIEKIEEHKSILGFSQRSHTIVEVLVSPQWFVKMDVLAKKVLNNLKIDKDVNFYPKRFATILKKWMSQVYDWTISRQLWWGHQIPAWYKKDKLKIQIESPGKDWNQDSDVLDTWFSSGIAPFSFLSWPKKSKLLSRHFPTNVLVTAYDIIFFWVARMYFLSLEIVDKHPFDDVLIHGLIRDQQGQKMSKSLKNGIDPMLLIDKYGSDSLRWFLLTNSTPGQDIRYSEKKMQSAWNFNNKIWNISRFIFSLKDEAEKELSDEDFWILEKFQNLEKVYQNKFKTYDFNIIGREISKFILNYFSSWYIEFLKSNSNKKHALFIFNKLLILIHPFLPFISDHIYKLNTGNELLEQRIEETKILHKSQYTNTLINIITELRKFRDENKISKKDEIFYYFQNLDLSPKRKQIVKTTIKKMANASWKKNQGMTIKLDKIKLLIYLDKNLIKKHDQLKQKRISFLQAEVKRAKQILLNKNFISKAPVKKVKLEKEKLIKFQSELLELETK